MRAPSRVTLVAPRTAKLALLRIALSSRTRKQDRSGTSTGVGSDSVPRIAQARPTRQRADLGSPRTHLLAPHRPVPRNAAVVRREIADAPSYPETGLSPRGGTAPSYPETRSHARRMARRGAHPHADVRKETHTHTRAQLGPTCPPRPASSRRGSEETALATVQTHGGLRVNALLRAGVWSSNCLPSGPKRPLSTAPSPEGAVAPPHHCRPEGRPGGRWWAGG